MERIYKYEVPITGEPVIDMPMGAEILLCGVQYGALCIWAIVSPDNDMMERRFYLRGTGQSLGFDLSRAHFIGTVSLQQGQRIYHLFEA